MGAAFDSIIPRARAFAEAQKFFMVATAPKDGRVNLSPKGFDTLRIIDEHTVAYLDVTGSGNETAAHVLENGRITFMFMAMEGAPIILRFYGQARVVRPADGDWAEWLGHFTKLPGTRQIFVANIDRVSTSCGFGVPVYEYKAERDLLINWADHLGPDGLDDYRAEKNAFSIDGLPTGYVPA